MEALSDSAFTDLKWKLTTHGTKEWRKLYPICMTDNKFKERELKHPGYLDAIYIKDWTAMRADGARVDPRKAALRAAGDKFAIQFRYSSTELDLNKSTFRAALQKSNHRQNECWINALYEHYGETLLRSDKSKNLITRVNILKLLGRTEENIQDGLTIEEVMPFFR